VRSPSAPGGAVAIRLMMDSVEDDFVNDEPLAAEQSASPRRRRRRVPSVLEPRPRRREQIRGRPNSTRGRTELFLRENPVPLVIGALAAGVAIGLAIRYASRSEEKETNSPLGRLNWNVVSLPFLWPLFRSLKEGIEGSADAVSEKVKAIDVDRYTKPIRKRWKSWTS
jgi:hypothetical protein